MPGKITDQVVAVTGGTRGIGLEFVSQLLQRGNTVVATGRDPASSPGLQQLAQQYGDKLILTTLEAADPNSIAQWAAKLKQAGRVQHIDVLINNAAINLSRLDGRLADLDLGEFTQTLTVNALGPLLVVRELLKQGLLGGDAPSLAVYISSRAGSLTLCPVVKEVYLYSYRASKAALNMLVVTSIKELTDRNISSVLLHPGRVMTDMNSATSDTFLPGSVTTEESVTGQLQVLERAASLASLNGKFYSYTGDEMAW